LPDAATAIISTRTRSTPDRTMADLSADHAHPGSTTASALNARDTSKAVTPASAAVERPPEEGSKFKTLLSILRKCVILLSPSGFRR
jgi:hypothetical protein